MKIGYYYTFDTISEALRFERTLKDRKVNVRLMPVPRRFSSSCGTCAAISAEDHDLISNIIKEENLIFHEIYAND